MWIMSAEPDWADKMRMDKAAAFIRYFRRMGIGPRKVATLSEVQWEAIADALPGQVRWQVPSAKTRAMIMAVLDRKVRVPS